MKNYLKQWNSMRVLRLAWGIIIIVQGMLTREWLLAGLGAVFSLMPLVNTDCCGISGCRTPVSGTCTKKKDL
jgi:hypothetical protein